MNLKHLIIVGIALVTFAACKKDEVNDKADLNVSFTGLEDLGADFVYEGWIIVDGSPITTGTFNVDGSGNISQGSFELDNEQLESATTFVLTIEPAQDPDPAPSDIHVLAGDFSGSNAVLSVDHGAALGTNFTDATGNFILATPTDGSDNNERSGVWFLDLTSGSPAAGLDLPTLPAGWNYEGWAVIDGQPVSTGTFKTAAGADAGAFYSGQLDGPPFPGEDFLINAPSGLTFPTDLSDATIVISVEPSPDNSPNPFALKPLVGPVPASAADHSTLPLNNNAINTNPSGTVIR